ncbi:hypothetical protein N0V82_008940 [Gnomoniopsis sp. IMI 355080]|nr:hypothetical protein N0V82_008940 [Gnomoniopsis sp. IMI 355080]
MIGPSTAFLAALVSLSLTGQVLADSNTAAPYPAKTFAECQAKTADPLQGCPEGTIYVSLNDTKADFNSIQSAILSIPNDTVSYYILIAAGNYYEQLNVTRSAPLYLLGQSNLPSQGKTYAADVSYNQTAQNDVQVWYNSANVGGDLFSDNVYTGVLTIGPTLNATLTGSGTTGFAVPDDTPFGTRDFRAYNIDFRNEYAPYSDGPAHAVGVSRANAGFYSCGFYSWQDTVYVGKLGNAYFYDVVVAGQTDFLYGFGTLYIAKSTLSLRHCGGGITAWKGTNTTFTNKYGVYIDSTQVIANNWTTKAEVVGECALGRPWNDAHRSIFMDSYFDTSILPAGYIEWSTTVPRVDNYTFMATWSDYGPGWNPAAEEASNITLVLNDTEVAPYRWPKDVFLASNGSTGNTWWVDHSVLVPF